MALVYVKFQYQKPTVYLSLAYGLENLQINFQEIIETFSPHTPGCGLPCKTWVRLNRVRTACAKSYNTLNRFGSF